MNNKLTPDLIEQTIAGEAYVNAADAVSTSPFVRIPSTESYKELQRITLCLLILRNGTVVIGESACASLANFDGKRGREVARANAVAKIWALEGYLLRHKLANDDDRPGGEE